MKVEREVPPKPSPATGASLDIQEDLRHLDLSAFSALRVLVAGDFMLDEYLWGRVERISPEAPVAVVDVERETRTLGGAGNVVNNLVALGARVEVLGLVGDDHPGQLLRQEMARLGVETAGLLAEPQRRTSRKTRVMAGSQQVVRIDRESRTPAGPDFLQAAGQFLQDRLPHLHAIVLSDYAKGALTPPLLQDIISRGRAQGLPVVVDPKGSDYSGYAGATVITPNRKEAELAAGQSLARREDLVRAGARLREDLGLDHLLITLGPDGMLLFPRQGPEVHIPTRAREVFDVSGAGDTVAAVMALGLAAWRRPPAGRHAGQPRRRGGGGQGGHRPHLPGGAGAGTGPSGPPAWRTRSWLGPSWPSRWPTSRPRGKRWSSPTAASTCSTAGTSSFWRTPAAWATPWWWPWTPTPRCAG